MLKPEGNVKVIDFGIAREYKEKNLSDTKVLGTKGYAPPEQYGSRQTDARSDIYALGMTMYNLITGIDPRPADFEYFPIRTYNPELSGGLERIIDKCLAIDPNDRYQNCNELMYALDHYEEEDDNYKKKQKRKLFSFVASLAFMVLMLIVGLVGQVLKNNENDKDYLQKINISNSTPYENRVSSYLEAIDLYGTDTRAYMKLLDAYTENQQFGDDESSQFSNKYNKNQSGFNLANTDTMELYYKAGLTYLYLYSGGDDTFRSRILKAYPFFNSIVENGSNGFEYYDVSNSYKLLGDFYSQYVVSSTSIKEPNYDDYSSLLESLRVCIDNVEQYEADDASYIRLVMYREILNLLNDHRKGLAQTGIIINEVTGIFNDIKDKTNALSVTQAKSLEVQEYINSKIDEYTKNLQRVYGNTEERSE